MLLFFTFVVRSQLFLLVLSVTLLIPSAGFAAFLENVPQNVTQPDGTVLHLLATGDEYYNFLHDARGLVIVRHPATGYLVYASKADGRIVPTGLVVGRADPDSAGLVPGVRPDARLMPSPAERFPDPGDGADPPREGAPKFTFINNVVVFIRFADEPEFAKERPIYWYDLLFNSAKPGDNSMYNYFREVSYQGLSVTSTFYPKSSDGLVVSYQDSHPRAYYQPFDEKTNPSGYSDDERNGREFGLLADAIRGIAGEVPADLVIDANGDGRVDNVCFVVSGTPTAWNTLLWPHRWSLYGQSVSINGKRVYDFNLQLESMTRNGVLCHEMSHTLGAPDLYHYSQDGFAPVGRWDIMESTLNPPQHMGAYIKYRYLKTLETLPEITTAGRYTLNPQTVKEGNCFKIASPNSLGEYFVLEYRRKTGAFESSLPGSGLLVYRINTAKRGNSGGPPDEVYLLRPGGSVSLNGDPSAAHFSADVKRTSLGDVTDPYPFLTDGSLGGLAITEVSSAGDTISFTVELRAPCALGGFQLVAPESPVFGTAQTLQWTPASGASGYELFLGEDPAPRSAGEVAGASTAVRLVSGANLYWKVHAKSACGQLPSSSGTWLLAVDPQITMLAKDVSQDGVGSEASGKWSYFQVEVPAGAANLKVTSTGNNGDADLYVRREHFPTSTTYSCRSARSGSNESCTVSKPEAGTYYIGLRPYIAFYGVTLTATYTVTGRTHRRVRQGGA